MKQAISGIMLAIFFVAGCAQNPITRFEYGSIRLDVSGRITEAQAVAMLNRQPGVYYCKDGATKQIFIEAKIVEVKNDNLEILGVQFFDGRDPLIAASSIQNTTPSKSPPIAVGGLVGIGSSSGGGMGGCPHGPGCNSCSSGGGGTGGGINIPIGGVSGPRGSGKTTCICATFDLNGSVNPQTGYLAFDIKVGVTSDNKIIVQPILIPATVLQVGNEPPVIPTKTVTTAVIIQNGQTATIGGLLTDSDEDLKQKVPILNDIPLLGRMFKSKGDNILKRNLILFVTPIIIESGE
ncbi:MAG: hypothetical protein GY794_12560 [bacterium]|nr:hypothetical protein [bacterium]